MATVRYDAATGCTGRVTPGAAAIRDHWHEVTGLPDYGILACRPIRGGTSYSVHSEGRAVDLGANAGNAEHKRKADLYCGFLISFGVELGMQYLIWNRRSRKPGEEWRSYGGASPHTDHIHTELNRDGAERVTLGMLRRCWRDFLIMLAQLEGDFTMSTYSGDPGGTKWIVTELYKAVRGTPPSAKELAGWAADIEANDMGAVMSLVAGLMREARIRRVNADNALRSRIDKVAAELAGIKTSTDAGLADRVAVIEAKLEAVAATLDS